MDTQLCRSPQLPESTPTPTNEKISTTQLDISTITNNVKLSDNILILNPTPLYIKKGIDDDNIIKNKLEIISKNFINKQIFVSDNQSPQKTSDVFTSQNAYVPYNSILSIEDESISYIKEKIFDGINNLLVNIYKFEGQYTYKILSSWMQKYQNGNFLSPHNHIIGKSPYIGDNNFVNEKIFSIAYYIDDGDPDTTQTYSGTISFINNNKLTHVRPSSGTLLIWENDLIHLVNPFYSKSNKNRFMISSNILVQF
jgi:hypothetical protein